MALVTGAAGGIGSAVARALAARGAAVVCCDLDGDGAVQVAAGLEHPGDALELDVRDESSWAAAVAATLERHGGLDVLVNNAGVLQPMPMVALSLEAYEATIAVNQTGVFLGMRAAVAPLVERGGGSIVNLSSIEGMAAQPFAFAYIASKFAVRGMTKAAAVELASASIRVNSVHPGYVDTAMLGAGNLGFAYGDVYDVASIPLGRLGAAPEVADVVAFLASDESRYCTGAEFVVDGGLTAAIAGTTGQG